MLPAPFFALLNRLLAGQTAARGHLARHAGKVLRFRLPGLGLAAQIGADGEFEATEGDAPADTEIELTPALVLRLVAGERQALAEAQVSGDGVLASDLKNALEAVDLALALKPLVGDVLAARVASGLDALMAWRETAAESAARSASEYLVHEARTLASRAQVGQFVHEVDELRDAAARLEARIALLENEHSEFRAQRPNESAHVATSGEFRQPPKA